MSHLPAEIVADRRWVSPGVGLRWLFVWLFWTVLLARRPNFGARGSTPTASPQVLRTVFPADSSQETAVQSTILLALALARLSIEAF
jgi:hypothetical protein